MSKAVFYTHSSGPDPNQERSSLAAPLMVDPGCPAGAPWMSWWWILADHLMLFGCPTGWPWMPYWLTLDALLVVPGCPTGWPWMPYWWSLDALLVDPRCPAGAPWMSWWWILADHLMPWLTLDTLLVDPGCPADGSCKPSWCSLPALLMVNSSLVTKSKHRLFRPGYFEAMPTYWGEPST